MDRRAFLRGGAAASAAVAAARLPGQDTDDPAVTVTPDLYRASPMHRTIADRALAAARESRAHCCRVVATATGATLVFYNIGSDGRIIVNDDEPSTREVYIEGAFLPGGTTEGL